MKTLEFKILSDEVLSFENFIDVMLNQASFPNTLGDLHKWIKGEYCKSGRHYHNFEHIGDCLINLSMFRDSVDHGIYGNSQAIFTAIYFHDIVYFPGRNNNEELSATVAESALISLGCKKDFIELVKKLIMATKHNQVLETDEEKLIADIDLLGFALPWEKYLEMTTKIYEEFGALYTKSEFINRRKGFLRKNFFSKDRIYYTPYFYENCEKSARDNFQRFLALE
ncbi:MAG: hypothetical protein WAV23_00795 [Minisyncoccia bacterium]